MSQTNIEKVLNDAFRGLPLQLSVEFEQTGENQFDVSLNLRTAEGKFRSGKGGSLKFERSEDARFLAMIEGSAQSFIAIAAAADDYDAFYSSCFSSELIVEYALTDTTLVTAEDFAARLATLTSRREFLAEAYIAEKAAQMGVALNDLSEEEMDALRAVGSFQRVFSTPSMAEFSTIFAVLVKNPAIHPLLNYWITDWSEAGMWSQNYAWPGGPLMEELLALGVFKLLENQGPPATQAEWFQKLSLIMDFSLEADEDDLERAGFIF